MQRENIDLEWVIFLTFSIKQQLLLPSCHLCCYGDFVHMPEGTGWFCASTRVPGNVTALVTSWLSNLLPLPSVGHRLQEQDSLRGPFSTAFPHQRSLVFFLPVKWKRWNVSFWHFQNLKHPDLSFPKDTLNSSFQPSPQKKHQKIQVRYEIFQAVPNSIILFWLSQQTKTKNQLSAQC